jgi:hypothetical protein
MATEKGRTFKGFPASKRKQLEQQEIGTPEKLLAAMVVEVAPQQGP